MPLEIDCAWETTCQSPSPRAAILGSSCDSIIASASVTSGICSLIVSKTPRILRRLDNTMMRYFGILPAITLPSYAKLIPRLLYSSRSSSNSIALSRRTNNRPQPLRGGDRHRNQLPFGLLNTPLSHHWLYQVSNASITGCDSESQDFDCNILRTCGNPCNHFRITSVSVYVNVCL